MKIKRPKYQQIAADIALKITKDTYCEGEKIHVRSSLASQYGVSSETARRAICILAEMKIVEVTKGSGVVIKSKKLAQEFIDKFDSVGQMNDLKRDILQGLEQNIRQSMDLKERVSDLIFRTEKFHSTNPFTPFQTEITKQAAYIGQNFSECNFWHHTMATVIAIEREKELIISPGPYAMILEKDLIFYIGEESCQKRVKNFFYSNN